MLVAAPTRPSRMATAGASDLPINPAFLQEIKQDNHDLKRIVDRLAVTTGSAAIAANHWDELTRLWSELRDQLAMHFGLEEAYGYFDLIVDADRPLMAAAEELKSQHAELFEQVRHLVDATARTSKGDPAVEGSVPEVTTAQEKLLRRYRRWLQDFKSHEEAELELILTAIDEDLGVGG